MPGAPLVVPPLLLVLILLVSAVAKLRDPRDTAAVFRNLKLPPGLLRLQVPRLLPYGELALAVLVLVASGLWYAAATTAMLVLFVAYFAVIRRALRQPYPIVCGCFGRLGLGLVTRHTLVRNGLLVAVAAVAWGDSWRGTGLGERLLDLGNGWWWLAGLALAVVTTAFVVREGPPPQYLPEGLRSDAYLADPIPYALLDGPDGPGSLWRLSDAAARLLVFWNPAGPESDRVVERRSAWQEQLAPVQVHLVAGHEWSQLAEERPDLADVLLGDPDGETSRRLGTHVMPSAVLLGTDRLLAGGPVTGLDAIEEMVEAAAGEIRAMPQTTAEVPTDDPAEINAQ